MPNQETIERTRKLLKDTNRADPDNIELKEKDVKRFCRLLHNGTEEDEAVRMCWPKAIFQTEARYGKFIERIQKHRYFRAFKREADKVAVQQAQSYFDITKQDHVNNLLKLKERALEKDEDTRLAFNIETQVGQALGFYDHKKGHDPKIVISFRDMINEINGVSKQEAALEGDAIDVEFEEIDNDDEIASLPLINN